MEPRKRFISSVNTVLKPTEVPAPTLSSPTELSTKYAVESVRVISAPYFSQKEPNQSGCSQ